MPTVKSIGLSPKEIEVAILVVFIFSGARKHPPIQKIPKDITLASTGLIVESIKAVVRDFTRLAGDEKLRRSMGEAGRKRVLNFFDHLDTAEMYVEFYREQLTLPNSRNSAGQLSIRARVVYAINFLREKIASRILHSVD